MIDYARLSKEIPVFEDEDEEENNSCTDSFIDDRINLTTGCIVAKDSERYMMAIYRFLMSFTCNLYSIYIFIFY